MVFKRSIVPRFWLAKNHWT